MRFALVFLVLPCLQDAPWWNGDWGFRRKIVIHNRMKDPLKAGFPVSITFNPGFLGMDKKCQPDYSDLRVVRGDKELSFYMDKVKDDSVVVAFRLAEDIKPRSADGYTLYYGNRNARIASRNKSDIYEFAAEFNREEDLGKFETEGLEAKVDGGHLSLKQKAAGSAKLKLKSLAPLNTFQFRMNFTADGAGQENPGSTQFIVHMRPSLKEGADPKIDAKVEELSQKLGDDEYRVREDATKAIIELGKAAVSKVEAIYKETKDAEVKWRCEYILQEIAKRNPIPGISVTYAFVAHRNPRMGTLLTVTTAIGGKTSTSQVMAVQSIELEVTRMEKFGSVTIRTPAGQIANIGELKEEIADIWMELKNLDKATVKVDSLSIQRYLSDQGRPTFEIDVEESRP
jgi:hypothetical protein